MNTTSIGQNSNRNKALKMHVALYVANLEQSINFYRKMFGIEPMKVRDDYAKFDVAEPPLNLTMNVTANATRGSVSHMGIQVASTEDVLTWRASWDAAGLQPKDEMATSCCYALQDKTWVQDPDGNMWEAFVVLLDNVDQNGACCTGSNVVEHEIAGTNTCC